MLCMGWKMECETSGNPNVSPETTALTVETAPPKGGEIGMKAVMCSRFHEGLIDCKKACCRACVCVCVCMCTCTFTFIYLYRLQEAHAATHGAAGAARSVARTIGGVSRVH